MEPPAAAQASGTITGVVKTTHWITLHQQGVPSGFKPLVVMDVWEHAYLLDFSPAEREKYIEAFFANLDWTAVNARLASPAADRLVRHAA